jgi:hypothetical protein
MLSLCLARPGERQSLYSMTRVDEWFRHPRRCRMQESWTGSTCAIAGGASPTGPVRAFATFRIVGDKLGRSEISQLLKIRPTQAYSKGERYKPGPRSPKITGKTGVWYLSTDKHVASEQLTDHLQFLLSVLLSDPHARGTAQSPALRQIIEGNSLRAIVSCFWHGPAGARPPSIPRALRESFAMIPAEIETDFDADEKSPPPPGRMALA